MRSGLLGATYPGRRMVAERHRLAEHHNKHCWRAFRGYQHRWPWTTLNPQNTGLSDFFCCFRLQRTLRVNFRWNILQIDQDNLRTKLNWCCLSWALAQISCCLFQGIFCLFCFLAGSAETDVGWGENRNRHLMASCVGNTCTKNY